MRQVRMCQAVYATRNVRTVVSTRPRALVDNPVDEVVNARIAPHPPAQWEKIVRSIVKPSARQDVVQSTLGDPCALEEGRMGTGGG